MVVHELIALLEKMPPDMDVCVSHGEFAAAYEVAKVYDIDGFVCIEGNLTWE